MLYCTQESRLIELLRAHYCTYKLCLCHHTRLCLCHQHGKVVTGAQRRLDHRRQQSVKHQQHTHTKLRAAQDATRRHCMHAQGLGHCLCGCGAGHCLGCCCLALHVYRCSWVILLLGGQVASGGACMCVVCGVWKTVREVNCTPGNTATPHHTAETQATTQHACCHPRRPLQRATTKPRFTTNKPVPTRPPTHLSLLPGPAAP